MNEKFTIALGVEVKDKITGFKGCVVARIEYLFGCNQYCLSPAAKKDGGYEESRYFDEGRLEVIGKGIKAKEVRTKENGGDNPDCPNR